MALPEVLDFDALLAPILEASPAGSDLRADPSPVSEYHAIRDARKAASAVERRLDQGDDAGPPDWRSVVALGRSILAGKSKDLEVTAYLIEGLVRLEGFAGLRDGFRLARGLIERYWETLYPDPGGTDYESRFSTILWLSGIDRPGTLIVPVRKIPFTDPSGGGGYNLSHHQMALSLDQVADAKVRQKRIDDGAVTSEMIRKSVAETRPAFYADLIEGIAHGREAFLAFCASLGERSGYDAPNSDLLGVLEGYQDVVADLASQKLAQARPAAASSPPPAAAPEAGDGRDAPPPPEADPGVIRDRGDALDRLGKIADFFRASEPHSIIPYALEQVIAWGKMPLPDLLAELIPDEAPRKNLFKQVGIRPPEAKK